jgi:hypothetical protein
MITSIQAAEGLEGTHVARDGCKNTSLDATGKRRLHRRYPRPLVVSKRFAFKGLTSRQGRTTWQRLS